MTKMKDFEILINAFVHIMLAIALFWHIEKKCYKEIKTKILFVVPLFSVFVGFYYIRCWIDGDILDQYWRSFRIIETFTNALFLAIIISKNISLKKKIGKW